MIVLGLTGYAGGGKDAVGDYLVSNHGFVKRAFATPLKGMLTALNPIIDGEGTRLNRVIADAGADWEKVLKLHFPEYRRLLQTLGTNCIRRQDPEFWVNIGLRELDYLRPHERVVFTDVRFPNEVAAVQNFTRPRGAAHRGAYATTAVWNIDRPGYTGDGHESEAYAGKMGEDHVIRNDEGLVQLGEKVDQLAYQLFDEDEVKLTA